MILNRAEHCEYIEILHFGGRKEGAPYNEAALRMCSLELSEWQT